MMIHRDIRRVRVRVRVHHDDSMTDDRDSARRTKLLRTNDSVEILGDSMGIAPKLQGRGNGAELSTWGFSFGTLSILGNEFTNPLNP